eukprot:3049468-Rhodomonas_salina.4
MEKQSVSFVINGRLFAKTVGDQCFSAEEAKSENAKEAKLKEVPKVFKECVLFVDITKATVTINSIDVVRHGPLSQSPNLTLPYPIHTDPAPLRIMLPMRPMLLHHVQH